MWIQNISRWRAERQRELRAIWAIQLTAASLLSLSDLPITPLSTAIPILGSPLRHPSSVPQKRHGAFSPSGLSQGFCPSPYKALTAGFPCVSTGANAGGFDGVAFPAIIWALASSSNSAWIYSAQSFTDSHPGVRSTSNCWRMDANLKATWLPPSFPVPSANLDKTPVSTSGSIVTRNS